MLGVYATFEELKEYLRGTQNVNFAPQDDQRLKQFCVEMSRKFDTECNRRFYPVRQTRYFDHPKNLTTGRPAYPYYQTSSWNDSPMVIPRMGYDTADTLLLDDDLLQVIALTTNNGATTISSSDYWLKTGDSYNYPPYDRVQLKPNGTTTLFNYADTPYQANALTGDWGYHEYYDEAWQLVDYVDTAINSTETQVTVGDVDGEDELGLSPRFKVQQLGRFGNSAQAEMFYVTNKSVDHDTLTIKRGVNGTTAAAQAAGTAIYLYRPMVELKYALEVLATWAYRRKDSVGGQDDYPVASPSGIVILPSKLPGEVKDMIAAYKRDTTR